MHGSHLECIELGAVPGGHGMHADWSSEAAVPLTQSVHEPLNQAIHCEPQQREDKPNEQTGTRQQPTGTRQQERSAVRTFLLACSMIPCVSAGPHAITFCFVKGPHARTFCKYSSERQQKAETYRDAVLTLPGAQP